MSVGLVSVGIVLYFLRSILAPFAMAVFAKILLDPAIEEMKKKGLPRPLAIAVTFLLSAFVVTGVAGIVAGSIGQLTDHVDEYVARFQELLWDLLYSIPESLGKRLDVGEIFALAVKSFKAMIGSLTTSIVSLLGQLLVTGLFLVFFLLSETRDEDKSALQLKIEGQVRDYMIVKVALSLLTAILTGALLTIGQVELALVFALLTFVLNFVPNIGPLVAVALPIPLLVLSPKVGLSAGIAILAGLILVQFVLGNFIEPKLMGERLALNPILVLFSLLLWGAIWGIAGTLLAIPLTAAMKLALQAQLEPSASSQMILVGSPEQISRATVMLSEQGKEEEQSPPTVANAPPFPPDESVTPS